MEHIFFEITIIIVVASVLSIIFRALKQPVILAYLVTGIILGLLRVFSPEQIANLQTLGQLGITLLLFTLGLELKLHELRSIGKTAIIAGGLQMWLTFFLSLSLLLILGIEKTASIYLAIAIAFSSTIVIVKILSDKKDLTSLHGKLAIGILLVQDFFAVFIIAFLTGIKAGGDVWFLAAQILFLILKLSILFGIVFLLSTKFYPVVLHRISRSPELLFIFSLAWVFAFAAIVSSPLVGFSIEIGGFLAGLAFANTAENFQIIARMRALRDFFIVIFFVVLGFQMRFDTVSNMLFPAIITTLFVLTAKPIIVMIVTHFLGYRKRTSFMTGITMGQISEFSLILLFIGVRLGHLSMNTVSFALFVSIFSFAFSSYMMQHSNTIYRKCLRYLQFLDAKYMISESVIEKEEDTSNLRDHIVVVGYHHMGESIVRSLENSKESLLVVDFNPDTVKKLQSAGVTCLFGDISDPQIQERAGFASAKLVISTVPDMEDNLILIEGVTHVNKKAKIIVMALDGRDAKELYKAGADYVVLPHLAGGRHVAKILKDFTAGNLNHFKEKDLAYLT